MRRVLFVALTSVLAGLAGLSLVSLPRVASAQPNQTPQADLVFTAHQSGVLPLAVTPTNTNAFPDPSIAASSLKVVSTSNTGIRISNPDGSSVAFDTLAGFFASVTPPAIVFNTRATFWTPQGRFVVCATALDLGMTPVSRLLIAVSDDNNPGNLTTDWQFGTVSTGRTTMMTLTDYSVISGIGWATNRFLVAFDNYSLTTGLFTDNDVYGFNNAELTGGTFGVANVQAVDQPAGYAGAGVNAFHLQPVQGAGANRLFSVGNPFAGSVQDRIAVYTTNTDGVVTGSATEVVTPWQSPPNAAAKGSLGGIPLTDALTKAIADPTATRVWFAHSVQANNPPARPVVRFYHYEIGTTTATEVAETSHPTQGYYMPSVAPDGFGNALGVFHGSDANSTISIHHQRFLQAGVSVQTPRLASTSGTTFDVAGQSSPFLTPWGGFTDAAAFSDRVWTHAELALDCERWKTEVHRFTTRTITLLDPDGGQTFHLGAAGPPFVLADVIPITWTPGAANGGAGDTIRIQFSPDGGATWPTLVTASTADDGFHSVSAGTLGGVTTQGRFRIQVVNGGMLVGSLEDTSDADFTITVRTTTTASSTPPAIWIPDNWSGDGDWVESPLFLPEDLTIHGLTVTVSITHPYIPDLEVYLVAPDGTSVVLHDQTGAPLDPPGGVPGPFGTRTYPTPTAPDANGGGAAGVTAFNNAFIGKRTRGWNQQGQELPWLLRVRDLNPGSVGTLNSWTLRASGPPSKRLDVTRADGGEQFVIGQNELLTWNNDPNNPVQGDVNLYLSRNGGADGYPELLNMLPIPAVAGQFNWAVTGPITSNAKIRVVPLDEGPNEPADSSAGVFRIRDPFVEVTYPNAPGISLLTGEQIAITWNRFPATGNVLIELLNADTLAVVETIAASTDNDGSFDWTPTAALAAGLIRITPLGMGVPPADSSDNPFCIVTKNLVVSAPGTPGPTQVDVDTNTPITWITTGITGNVDIELTRDGGMTWEPIATVGHGSSPFVWTVTGPGTTQAQVRVTSVSDPTVTDTGDTFTIRQATLEVTKPTAANTLAISSVFDIQWTSTAPLTGMDNVRIELQRNGGAWELISASTPNDGSFKWTVTAPARESCIFRITALAYPSTFDESEVFPIVSPRLTVKQPNGGEGLGIGSTYKITWDSFPLHDGVDNLSRVRIFISRTGFAGAFTEEITPMGGVNNTGEFDWTVTGAATTDAVIEIRTFLSGDGGMTYNVPAPFPEQTDRSDAVFRIDNQQISVGQPAAMDKWLIGTTRTVQWSAVGVPGNVRIFAVRGMVSTEITPMGGVPANQNTFNWLVAGPPHVGAVIRVESVANAAVFGNSSAFDILDFGLSVTQPNGHNWGVGTQRKIKWTFASGFTGIAEVLIQKAGEMAPTSLGSAAAPGGNGELDYTVSGPTGAATVFVRVNGTMPLVEATGALNIVAQGITVTAPTLNQKVRTGHALNITWTHGGLDQEGGGSGNVKITVTRNGGGSETIVASTPNDGSFTWNPVTPPDSNNVKVKVESVEFPAVSDESDQFQIITPAIVITAPTEGTSVIIGEILNIQWTANEVDGPLTIEITRNGGMSYETIVAGVNPNDGSYAWQVTGDGGGNGGTNNRIRITDTGGTAVVTEMNGPFTIVKPTLTVGFPNGGQSIVQNTTQTITWSTTGIPGGANVMIELLQNDAPIQVIAASTPNDGSHSWTPTLVGVGFKIRISRIGSPAATDDSNSNFTVIAPSLTVIQPNGGEKVKRNKLLAIAWTSNTINAVGGGGTVDIQFSNDGGATFTTVIPDAANDGFVQWVVTPKVTKKARIRVVWKPNPAVADSSNANFQIVK